MKAIPYAIVDEKERPITVAQDVTNMRSFNRGPTEITVPPDVACDELVMMLLPKSSWVAIEGVAKQLGVTAPEVIGIALKRLQDALDKI